MSLHGGPEVLEYKTSVPCPFPSNSKQVTVDIAVAGLNPVDFKMRIGPIADFLYPKPKIIGSDFAGVIINTPPGSKFVVGQRVFGMLPLLGTPFGSYCSRCCIDESILCPAPQNVSLRDLGSIPLVACTIIQAMRPVISSYNGLTEGKKCFIQAGSGGLGTFAIQYCANVLKMHVATSCSPRNFDLLRG